MSAHEGFPLSGSALASHPDFAKLALALQAPQAALRARFNAAILDLLLLGALSQALAPSLAPGADAATRAGLFLAFQFVYFFLLELWRGQTIGKRVFHVRVASADGHPASTGQIATRNALRVFDTLPYLYASGLFSLTRTGPARRQRLGDMAARTTVVLEPDAKGLPTPGWLLPAMTLVATVLSTLIVILAVKAGDAGGSWSSARGANLRAGFVAGCEHGRADLVATCECVFARITSLPAYDTPDRFETLVPTARRALADGSVNELPPELLAAGRSCVAASGAR